MLTEIACRTARPDTKPRKLSDSAGLYLYVTPTGFKSWRMKYRIGRVEKRLVIGAYPEMSLREARDRRDEARRLLRDGRDPSIERKKLKAAQVAGAAATLERFARDWHAARTPGWQPGYAKNVLARLEKNVFPALGSVPIGEVTAPMVLQMLQRIERRGSLDVARRVRQHIADLFRTAIALGAATFNPGAGIERALKSRTRTRRPAVRTVPEARQLIATIDRLNVEPTTRLASRFLALTAVRPAMVRLAVPSEFEDLDGSNPIWRIPAAKMKLTAQRRADVGFEFVVPLAPAAADLVRLALSTFATKLVFPSSLGKPISDSTLSKLYRSAGYIDLHVPHGWRATFSTVMNELAAIENRVGDRDVIDLMLGHVPNGVEAAYNRYAYLPRRRELAHEWAALLMVGAAPLSDLTVPRQRGRPEATHERGGNGSAPGPRGKEAAARRDGQPDRQAGARPRPEGPSR